MKEDMQALSPTMRSLALSGIILLVISCASGGTIGGGPRDVRGPRVDIENSSPGFQTDLQEREFYFTFDEYVELDTRSDLIVSPPLEHRPDLLIRGKTLTVTLDDREVLKDNTTYTFNFGNSIQDITERNVIENFRYVFSTGPVIDSLAVSGLITDAETNNPIDGAVVMLYRSLTDSSSIKGKPDFISYTDKQGRFSIENLPVDSFYLIALTDENVDYIYQQGKEKIAYSTDGAIDLSTSQSGLRLSMIQESPPLQGSRLIQKSQGYYVLVLNQAASGVELLSPRRVYQDAKRDSIRIWSLNAIDTAILTNGVEVDTAYLRVSDTSAIYRQLRRTAPTSEKSQTAETRPLFLRYSNPIATVMTDTLVLADSLTIRRATLSRSTQDSFTVAVRGRWLKGDEPFLYLPSAAVTDIYGQTSSPDTLKLKVREAPDYSAMVTSIQGFDSSANYIVRLIQSGGVKQENLVSQTDSVAINYGRLIMGDYQIHIIRDDNQNGKRDAGSYARREKAELLIVEKVAALRAGWDVEMLINIADR